MHMCRSPWFAGRRSTSAKNAAMVGMVRPGIASGVYVLTDWPNDRLPFTLTQKSWYVFTNGMPFGNTWATVAALTK